MFVYTPGDVIAGLFCAAAALFAVGYVAVYYGKRAVYAIKRAFKR